MMDVTAQNSLLHQEKVPYDYYHDMNLVSTKGSDVPMEKHRKQGHKSKKKVTMVVIGSISGAIILTLILLLLLPNNGCSRSLTVTSQPSSFRAAIYEHIPYLLLNPKAIVPRKQAVELMEKNLNVYKDQTKKAKQQGAQIIVFPEDGIYGMSFTRKSIFPFLERIPDPEKVHWSPCLQPNRFPDTPVQKALSCMAQENKMYVVANMGDRVPCNSSRDPNCPSDEHYQYNTDVAYGPDGTLRAKYHKVNLFFEHQFDVPKSKVVFFDTPFGRFGMLTCFDLLFKDPAVTMVTKYNITNIAFPTAWMDALPLLSAIGYHSSFARGLGVNFLAANIHLPLFRFHGSGIYTPRGMSAFYYNNGVISPGKLLVSTISTLQPNPRVLTVKGMATNVTDDTSTSHEFNSTLFDDEFTFRLLSESSGELNVCQRNVCCSLTYRFAEDQHPASHDLFAFGAFDGLHTYQGQYYFQICTLVKCAEDSDKSTCGSPTNVSTTKFKSFSITGHFQTDFVYPQVILTNSGQLALADSSSWSFKENTLTTGSGLDSPVLSAALFGRYYSQD